MMAVNSKVEEQQKRRNDFSRYGFEASSELEDERRFREG
jgi:hypothetical protein